MAVVLLAPPFETAALAEASTDTLKASLLAQVQGREVDPMGKKVRFAKENLMPLFEELERRNPTPDLTAQIPLLKGIWLPLWSTIPFQDVLPGRVYHESYQIFDDSGYYANLARYKPGRKSPWLSWLSRWLISYDLLIMQSYGVSNQPADSGPASSSEQAYWDIQNVCIRQSLRVGSRSFGPQDAEAWFEETLAKYQTGGELSQTKDLAGGTRITPKQFEQIAQARPQLEHLYIDAEFRLVKTQREKSQRPSYTVAVRSPV